jgi:hypothetical protein
MSLNWLLFYLECIYLDRIRIGGPFCKQLIGMNSRQTIVAQVEDLTKSGQKRVGVNMNYLVMGQVYVE